MKGVLFDFWGTLVDNALRPSPVSQTKRIMGLKMSFKDYIMRFEEAFMTQEFEDLYGAFENVCKEFDVEPDKELLDQLVGMWNKSLLMAEPYPETIEVLEELSDDYKLGLISNTPRNIKGVLEKFDLEKYFDAIVLSCDIGVLKTDPKMFETALDELGLDREEVIMVGDSMETDVKGAESAGITPVLIDRRDTREYKNKINSLKEVKDFLEE